MSDRATQKARILSLLQSRRMIALPELLDLRIANYRARLSELRKDGYDIVCWRENRHDGQVHTRYELKGQTELFGSRT